MQFPRAALEDRGHRITVNMTGSHPVDSGSTPAVRSKCLCGGSSVVESERAKLGTGVLFPSTALEIAGIVQRQDDGLPSRLCGFDSRCPLQLTNAVVGQW